MRVEIVFPSKHSIKVRSVADRLGRSCPGRRRRTQRKNQASSYEANTSGSRIALRGNFGTTKSKEVLAPGQHIGQRSMYLLDRVVHLERKIVPLQPSLRVSHFREMMQCLHF